MQTNSTRQDIDQQVAQLREHQPRTYAGKTFYEIGESVRGQVEYHRWLKTPGVEIHADGVIEIPESV